jgi:capsular polysaccharide biosynthesis protein
MDIRGLSVVAWRRWYIVLPGLLLTALVTLFVGDGIAPDYEISGAVRIVQAPGTNVETSADSSTASALQIIVSSSQTRSSLAEAGLDADYELTVEDRSPIISVFVSSPNAVTAVATGRGLIDELTEALAAEQDERGVPTSARLALQILDAPDSVIEVVSPKIRVMAVAAVVGIVLSLGLAILFDNLMPRMRSRRSSRADTASQDEANPIEDDASPVTDDASQVEDDASLVTDQASPNRDEKSSDPPRPRPWPRHARDGVGSPDRDKLALARVGAEPTKPSRAVDDR